MSYYVCSTTLPVWTANRQNSVLTILLLTGSISTAFFVESVYTAGTGKVFLATGKPSNSVYINELIQFLSLWSFVDCGFRVMVSSRIRVSVSFLHLFLCDVG